MSKDNEEKLIEEIENHKEAQKFSEIPEADIPIREFDENPEMYMSGTYMGIQIEAVRRSKMKRFIHEFFSILFGLSLVIYCWLILFNVVEYLLPVFLVLIIFTVLLWGGNRD